MTQTAEIRTAVDTAIARGIGRFDAAPPLHRLLWAAGVQVRPPHYSTFARNAALLGGLWGAWMALFGALYALHVHSERGLGVVVLPAGTALLMGVVFGFAMAMIIRSRARAAGLPDWDELTASMR